MKPYRDENGLPRVGIVHSKTDRDYDFMVRCLKGHFIADVRRVGGMGWLADAYCKACQDWHPIDTRQQMARIAHAYKRSEVLA